MFPAAEHNLIGLHQQANSHHLFCFCCVRLLPSVFTSSIRPLSGIIHTLPCWVCLHTLHNAFQCSSWGFYTVLACSLKLIYHSRADRLLCIQQHISPSLLTPASISRSVHPSSTPPSSQSCVSYPSPQVRPIFNYLSETPGLDPLPPSSLPRLIRFKLARNLPMRIQRGEIYNQADIERTARALWEGCITTYCRCECVEQSFFIVDCCVHELILSMITYRSWSVCCSTERQCYVLNRHF